MAYLPFGEVLFEEHSSSFSSPNLFNGKELDRETNMTYYSARYLDMKTSLWLNVDPLAEKFFNQSPFNYVLNNPVRFTDPTGMSPEEGAGDEDPPKKVNNTSPNLNIIKYEMIRPMAPQSGYVGQGLDDVITAGIQWLASEISGGDVSKETSENIQFAASLAVIIVTKGKNPKAGKEVVEKIVKAETKGAAKGSLTATKEAKGKIGLKSTETLKKGEGKFGSPQRGDLKKGYRLDPAHLNAKPVFGEEFPHVNYWDSSKGKRGSGGVTGAIPIKY